MRSEEVANTESFEDFVHATGRSFYRAALLLCGGDHHLAEDLTQATYVKVFVKWRRVSRAEDPVAYTRSVLTRTFLSHRRLRSSYEHPIEQRPDASSTQDVDCEVRLDLTHALRLLSAKDRAVIVLRYHYDLSTAQTAQELEVSEAVVRQRLRRALTRLRTHLPYIDDSELSTAENPIDSKEAR